MLAWVDIESTGLDPDKCTVLEVACVVTDDALVEVADGRLTLITGEAARIPMGDVHPKVAEMHSANGLWMESSLAGMDGRRPLALIDHELAAFLRTRGAEGAQLAGSTISFDRAFMARHLPISHGLLHYRNLDVTTLNELARRFWPGVHENRPRESGAAHRAMPDVLHSIAVARHYVEWISACAKIVQETA